jgi:hypothetical protein
MDNLNLIDNDIKLNNNSISIDDIIDEQLDIENTVLENTEATNEVSNNDTNSSIVETEEECTALVELKPHGLLVAQTMFRKSIKISIKSFLISLSLGFLNLFF